MNLVHPLKSYLSLLNPLRFGATLGVAIFHQMFGSWAWISIGVPGFERYVAANVLYPSARVLHMVRLDRR